MKYTEGPWRIEEKYGGIKITNGNFEMVTEISSYDTSIEEDIENAQLIAAAPELLEVAKETKDFLEIIKDEVCGSHELLEVIEKVISKAEGDNS